MSRAKEVVTGINEEVIKSIDELIVDHRRTASKIVDEIKKNFESYLNGVEVEISHEAELLRVLRLESSAMNINRVTNGVLGPNTKNRNQFPYSLTTEKLWKTFVSEADKFIEQLKEGRN